MVQRLRKFLLILFILNLINEICSFNSTDFCFFKQDSDVLSKCKNYQCGQSLCSNDKQTCDDSNMNLLNKYIFQLSSIYPIEKMTEFLFSNFQSSIKECKRNDLVSLNSEICLNTKNCKQIVTHKSFRLMFFFKSLQCSCLGKFNYDCGHMVCSTKKETCEITHNLSRKHCPPISITKKIIY